MVLKHISVITSYSIHYTKLYDRIISAIIAITIAAVLLFLHDTVLFYLSISLISVLILNEIFAALKCLQYKITVAICYIFAIALPLFLYNNLLSYRYPFFRITSYNVCYTKLLR